jgi:hypothetical protein
VTKTLKLSRVQYVPKELAPGILYVSEKYRVAAHLCACGCGNKVSVPLGPTEWTVEETNGKPSMKPSIGSWQLPCQSHYWILGGEVRWSEKWSPEQIERGRRAEEAKREAYYDARERRELGLLGRIWNWLKGLF